jgi:PKD repeat protein
VKFKDTSNCKATSWNWNFADGSRSTLQNPEHKFTKTGSYRVCLSVKCGGTWKAVCKTVIVK